MRSVVTHYMAHVVCDHGAAHRLFISNIVLSFYHLLLEVLVLEFVNISCEDLI